MNTFDILAGVRGFGNSGCASGVPMVFHYSCSFSDKFASKRTQRRQDRAILGRGLYVLAISTELQNEKTFRKSICLSVHWDSNYQIRQQVSFVVCAMVVSTQF